MESYSEVELSVGDTILIGDRTLTLLDTEGELGLFQLDADNAYRRVSVSEFHDMVSEDYATPCWPR